MGQSNSKTANVNHCSPLMPSSCDISLEDAQPTGNPTTKKTGTVRLAVCILERPVPLATVATLGLACAVRAVRRGRRQKRRRAHLRAPVEELAKCMAYCREYASPLSFTDLACGLARMNQRAIKREPKQKGRPNDLLLSDHDLLASLMHYLSIAEAAYACNSVQFSLISHLPETAVLRARWKADQQTQSPAYVLAIDVVRQTVIVAVRGTAEPIDFLTTIAFKPEPFLGGFAHVGILQSARNILSAVRNDVHDALSRYPTLGVTITGHSLGGGVGALLALLMEQEVPEARVHCFAFSPPSCLSLALARRSAACVTSVAATHDIVPSLSVGSFNRLAKEFNTSGKSSVPSKSYDPGLDMYPPGAFLLVGWVDSTEGPDRRVRRPVLRPSEFFTRKMGINWTQAPSNVRWKVTQAQPEDFNNLTVSCWSWSDHMLTTVGEALRSVQSQSISRGEHLL